MSRSVLRELEKALHLEVKLPGRDATYPGSKMRKYYYNESGKTSGANLPFALTRITDENDHDFATFEYDSLGRAISSEHAGSADLTTVLYNSDGSATVTDSLSNVTTVGFSTTPGIALPTAISGPGQQCPFSATGYDGNGYPSSVTDFNGNRKNLAHDGRGLETQRVDGLTSGGGTTGVTRTTSTGYR